MEEKKLTDGELLRLLAIFAKDDEPNGVRLLAEGALDLIHRLQKVPLTLSTACRARKKNLKVLRNINKVQI